MHVCFVCLGNICRSPMAAAVFRDRLEKAGLDGRVRVTSAGTGEWHIGQPADPRAARILEEHGYCCDHVAAQVNEDHLNADLLVALDGSHERALRRLVHRAGGDPGRIRMLRSFDPAAAESNDLDVPDPYYYEAGFPEVLSMVEATMPGLLEWVRERLDD